MNVGILLPFSREQETEADWLGMQLAARAGYDPRAGIQVWQRMAELSGGGGVEFLSTHPSHETRIANMKMWMPDALALYRSSNVQVSNVLPRPSQVRDLPARNVSLPVFTSRGCRHQRIEGKAGASFHFTMSEAAYIQDVHVSGPGGIQTVVKVGSSLEASNPRSLNLWRASAGDPPLPSGQWILTYRGVSTGQPFSQAVQYILP